MARDRDVGRGVCRSMALCVVNVKGSSRRLRVSRARTRPEDSQFGTIPGQSGAPLCHRISRLRCCCSVRCPALMIRRESPRDHRSTRSTTVEGQCRLPLGALQPALARESAIVWPCRGHQRDPRAGGGAVCILPIRSTNAISNIVSSPRRLISNLMMGWTAYRASSGQVPDGSATCKAIDVMSNAGSCFPVSTGNPGLRKGMKWQR